MNNERVNIIVCSSDLKPENIQRLAVQDPQLILISTDWFYPNERKRFEAIFKNVSFYCFNEFLSDADLERCDNLVREQCKNLTGLESYYGKYVEGIKYFKCQLLVEVLNRQFKRFSLYCHPTSLGISSAYFQTIKCTNLNDLYLSSSERYIQYKHQIKMRLLSIFQGETNEEAVTITSTETPKQLIIKVDVFEYNNAWFVILGGLKRLKNKSGRLVFSGEIDLVDWENELKTDLPEMDFRKLNFGVELHQFKYSFTHLFEDVSVIADGYWPPNYGYANHGIYPSNWQFACLSESDVLFCNNAKLKNNRLFQFLHSPLYLPEIKVENQRKNTSKTVVLLSQCTSEWTALINRSDAGKLIETFANLAKTFPETKFIIRPHPGMTLPVHDGEKSIERIHKFVKNLNLKNLSLSNQTIAEDFNIGDIFITEYSTAVFESMALNKICLSCNLTKRRNYLEYFTNLGFLHAETESELSALVDACIKGDEATMQKFNSAQNRYKLLF